MFEIGFLCPKNMKRMDKRKVGGEKPVLELKEMNQEFILLNGIVCCCFHFLISIFHWLLVLTMLISESC